MNVKRIVATEWIVALIFIPGGVITASIITASVNPHDPNATYAYNMGWATGALFGFHSNGATWGLALTPYMIAQVVRLTKWAIYARSEPRHSVPRLPSEHSIDSATTNVDSPNLVDESGTRSGFFTQLINGDYGLARTYWLFSVAVGLLLSIFTYLFALAGPLGFIGGLLLSATYQFAALLGTWRASKRYSGPRAWSLLAQVATIIGLAVLALTALGAIALLIK